MDIDTMVAAVKAHAMANYNIGGWDYVVETYDDQELAEAIGRCRSVDSAIRKIGRIVAIHADYRSGVRATIW